MSKPRLIERMFKSSAGKTTRCQNQRTRRRRLFLQTLENRRVLTGVCDVAVDDGDLQIECDDADNDVIITQVGPESFTLSSGAGTMFDDGGGPLATLTVDDVDDDFEVELEGGSDVLTLDGTVTPLTVPDDLEVDGGDGDNTVNLFGTTVNGDVSVENGTGFDVFDMEDATIDGDLEIENGDGDSTTLLNAASGVPSAINGDVSIENGTGFDILDVQDISIDGDLEVDNGDGTDGSSTFIGDLTTVPVEIDGDIEIDNDDGYDFISIDDTTIEGDVSIDNGDGGSHTDFGFNGTLVSIDGDLEVENGEGFDAVHVEGTMIGGDVSIDNGDGGSSTTFAYYGVGAVDIDGDVSVESDLGADAVHFGSAGIPVTIGGETEVETGADDDLITAIDTIFGDGAEIDCGGDLGDVFTDLGGNTGDIEVEGCP